MGEEHLYFVNFKYFLMTPLFVIPYPTICQLKFKNCIFCESYCNELFVVFEALYTFPIIYTNTLPTYLKSYEEFFYVTPPVSKYSDLSTFIPKTIKIESCKQLGAVDACGVRGLHQYVSAVAYG